jgi:hypothetical protein
VPHTRPFKLASGVTVELERNKSPTAVISLLRKPITYLPVVPSTSPASGRGDRGEHLPHPQRKSRSPGVLEVAPPLGRRNICRTPRSLPSSKEEVLSWNIRVRG